MGPALKLASQHKMLPGLGIAHASQICVSASVVVKVKALVAAYEHGADMRLRVLRLVADVVIGGDISAAECLSAANSAQLLQYRQMQLSGFVNLVLRLSSMKQSRLAQRIERDAICMSA